MLVDPRLLNRARFSEDVRTIFDERRARQLSPGPAVLINVVPLGYVDQTSIMVGIVGADRLLTAISVRVEQVRLPAGGRYRVNYAHFGATGTQQVPVVMPGVVVQAFLWLNRFFTT